jgi:ParB family chromosome partitioning protein
MGTRAKIEMDMLSRRRADRGELVAPPAPQPAPPTTQPVSPAPPPAPAPQEDEQILHLPLTAISHFPGGNQRKSFDQAKLEELAASIKIHGVVQPIIVNEVDGRYVLVAGERRLRASGMAGRPTIPARVLHLPENVAFEIMLIENVHREDLNPIDEALAYKQLLSFPGATQTDVARQVGKSQPHINEYLQLLELPSDLQHQVATGALGVKSGLAYLRKTANVPAPVRERVAQKLAEEKPTTREAPKVIDQVLQQEGIARAITPKPEQPKVEPPTHPAPGTQLNLFPSDQASSSSAEVTYCFNVVLHVKGRDFPTALKTLVKLAEASGFEIGAFEDAWGKDTDEEHDEAEILKLLGLAK